LEFGFARRSLAGALAAKMTRVIRSMVYFSFAGASTEPVEVVLATLREHVSPAPWFPFTPVGTEFQGSVMQQQFSLVQSDQGKNVLNPWIRGHIRAGPTGTIVEARLTFRPWLWGAMVLFSLAFGPSVARAVSATWHGLRIPDDPAPYQLAGLWLGVVLAFYIGACRARNLMFRVLELRKTLLGG